MDLKDLAPWIAIAVTLILSILVPLFTQIANNRHQRKMQQEQFEREERQKKIKAYEAFLLNIGGAVTAPTKEALESAGSSLYHIYIFVPKDWLNDLDTLSTALRMGETKVASGLLQKLSRLIAEDLKK